MPANIAHRGARSIAPENTLVAARKAHETGADLWETDIRITRDGQLIIIHDDTLLRTTNITQIFPKRVNQPVSRFSFEELGRLDAGIWFMKTDPFGEIARGNIDGEDLETFRGEAIPTLEEALKLTRKQNWKINLELKELDDGIKDFPLPQEVLKTLSVMKMEPDQVVISSFHHPWLKIVKQIAPEIKIQALIGDDLDLSLDWGDYEFDTYNALHTMVSDDDIRKLKAMGKAINLFTVNDPEEMTRFINLGVDGIITDYPQHLAALLLENPKV